MLFANHVQPTFQPDPRRFSLGDQRAQLVPSTGPAAPPKAASASKVPKIPIDLTRRLIFPGHVETPRRPAAPEDSALPRQAREETTKLQLTRLRARVEAEQQASERLSGQTKTLETDLKAQEWAAQDCSEELEVAEEAAKVALSESILLQRKLCEICRHLEVRAAFEESIQKAPDFE
ncbi:hypothetical protein FOZ62_014437, partial [Perkinsus olseni]